jgi:DNA-binding response OmpR family regulator
MMKRILLVDDESQLLFSIKEYLSRMNYDVTPAESGSEALEKFIEFPPDLIVSDILMEDMDGLEFQRRVSALTGNSIPFIFLTAKSDLRDRLDGLRQGADDYVTKPFEPEELEARIAAVLHRVDQIRRDERRDLEGLRVRILSQVASRLRTPVTSLMAHLNLLLSERFGENQIDQTRYLESALEDASVLSKLINDLSWTATSAAEEEILLRREPIRIAPVVRGAAARAARIASEKNVKLQISCGGLLSGNIDRIAMTRALSGLLEAAVELSPPGTKVRISGVRAREGGLEYVITDGGCSDFGREGSDDMADALDYARRVVKAHGGQITTRREKDDRYSVVIWVPGRVAKHVGRKL